MDGVLFCWDYWGPEAPSTQEFWPRLAVEIAFSINGTAIFDEAVASNLPLNRCTWIASAKELNANLGLVELLDETTISEQLDIGETSRNPRSTQKTTTLEGGSFFIQTEKQSTQESRLVQIGFRRRQLVAFWFVELGRQTLMKIDEVFSDSVFGASISPKMAFVNNKQSIILPAKLCAWWWYFWMYIPGNHRKFDLNFGT